MLNRLEQQISELNEQARGQHDMLVQVLEALLLPEPPKKGLEGPSNVPTGRLNLVSDAIKTIAYLNDENLVLARMIRDALTVEPDQAANSIGGDQVRL